MSPTARARARAKRFANRKTRLRRNGMTGDKIRGTIDIRTTFARPNEVAKNSGAREYLRDLSAV